MSLKPAPIQPVPETTAPSAAGTRNLAPLPGEETIRGTMTSSAPTR